MLPLATFHPFPRLPWELRNEIWKQSIRPLDRPGAHIFCLDLREPEDVTAKECDIQCPRILSVPLHFERPCPPLVIGEKFIHMSVSAKTLSSGPDGNPSTYMVDGGLWTACKESRAVMEHTFNHQKWDPIRKAYPAYWKLWKDTLLDRMDFDMPPPPPLSPGSDDSSPSPPRPPRSPRERRPTPVDPYGAERSYLRVPATAFFWSSPSLPCSLRSNELDKADHSKGQAAASPRFVTVLPMQDLIIIRPLSWTPHIHEGYWQALEHGFPFGAKKYGFPGFCGWKGFAIEYDPSWGERQTWGATWRDDSIWLDDGSFKLPDGTVGVMDSIYKAVSNFEQIQTIWLIDYRLEAKQNTLAAIRRLDSSQKVFYGGDGCQFVEVYREFVESGGGYLNEYYTEGIDGENSAMSQGSCHWFIEEFEVRMFGDLYDSDESVDSNYSRYPPHIGLLACLP